MASQFHRLPDDDTAAPDVCLAEILGGHLAGAVAEITQNLQLMQPSNVTVRDDLRLFDDDFTAIRIPVTLEPANSDYVTSLTEVLLTIQLAP
jgi:hypothetical protein